MRLFSSDLFRNFGIGFVAGALMIGVASFDDWRELKADIAPAAQAAELTSPHGEIASEFLIEVDQ